MFDWDKANLGHIAEHGVEDYEAEEAVLDPERKSFPVHRGPKGERRKGVLGRTEAGRILVVIVEERRKKLRVCTARKASPAEQKRYWRKS
jgi:uncharacterized protein